MTFIYDYDMQHFSVDGLKTEGGFVQSLCQSVTSLLKNL